MTDDDTDDPPADDDIEEQELISRRVNGTVPPSNQFIHNIRQWYCGETRHPSWANYGRLRRDIHERPMFKGRGYPKTVSIFLQLESIIKTKY